MQRQNMTEEEMRAFSNEVLPHLKQIKKAAERNGVEDGLRIWMSGDYISLEGSGLCGWELYDHGGSPVMKFEKRVPLSEDKTDAE